MTEGATTGTFAPIPNDILRRTDLSHGAKLVCARLVQYAGTSGNQVFPKQDKLGVEVGMSERAVQRFLVELENLGLIESQKRGRGQTNTYVLKPLLLTHRMHFDPPEVSPQSRKKEVQKITADVAKKLRMR